MNALAIGNNSNNALPCYHFNAALAELLDYNVHVKIPKGKIKELALKYQLTAKEYARLKVYASRARHDNGNKLDAGALRRSTVTNAALRRSNRKYPVNAHGRIFKQVYVPAEMLDKLPSKCEKTKLKGFATDDVSINAFGDGRLEIYEKTGNSRDILTKKLADCGWTDTWTSLFFEALDKNYREVHIAVYDPDAPEYCNLPLEFKNGMVKVGADSSPFLKKKTLEVILNFGTLEQKVEYLSKLFDKFTGNTSIATALIQLNSKIDALSNELYALKSSPSIQPAAPIIPSIPNNSALSTLEGSGGRIGTEEPFLCERKASGKENGCDDEQKPLGKSMPGLEHSEQPKESLQKQAYQMIAQDYHYTTEPETGQRELKSSPLPTNRCPKLKHWYDQIFGCGTNFIVAGDDVAPEHALLFEHCCVSDYLNCKNYSDRGPFV